MLKEGLAMSKSAGVGDEMKSVEAELEEKEHDLAVGASQKDANLSLLEAGRNEARHDHGNKTALSGLANLLGLILSPAWVQTFIMTFLGEWGDRSQIATIAMAAGQDYWWVTLGAILGHACCTGLAVIGGAALAGRVSMRVGKLNPCLVGCLRFPRTKGARSGYMVTAELRVPVDIEPSNR